MYRQNCFVSLMLSIMESGTPFLMQPIASTILEAATKHWAFIVLPIFSLSPFAGTPHYYTNKIRYYIGNIKSSGQLWNGTQITTLICLTWCNKNRKEMEYVKQTNQSGLTTCAKIMQSITGLLTRSKLFWWITVFYASTCKNTST